MQAELDETEHYRQNWMKLSINHVVVDVEFVPCLYLIYVALGCTLTLCSALV